MLLVSTRVLYESSRQAMIGPKSIYCCISGFRMLLAKSPLSMFLCLVRKAFALLLCCMLSLLVFELCAGHRQVDGLQDKFARWGGLTPSNPERIQLGKSIEHGCGTVVWQVTNHWGSNGTITLVTGCHLLPELRPLWGMVALLPRKEI